MQYEIVTRKRKLNLRDDDFRRLPRTFGNIETVKPVKVDGISLARVFFKCITVVSANTFSHSFYDHDVTTIIRSWRAFQSHYKVTATQITNKMFRENFCTTFNLPLGATVHRIDIDDFDCVEEDVQNLINNPSTTPALVPELFMNGNPIQIETNKPVSVEKP